MRTLAVDVVDVRRVRVVGVEAVEVLVLVVRYALVLSVAVEVVDIGRTASPEMDLVETREAGRNAVDVPTFPVLFIEIVKCERAVECVLSRELGRKEEVKLAEDGDMRIDEDVVVDLRIGIWDFMLEVVCLALDPVLARETTLAGGALVIFRGV